MATRTPPLSARGNAPGASAREERLRVLVVDGDEEVRRLLDDELTDCGYAVVAVPSAEHALEALNAGAFTAVVTDIRLPGIDGVALTRWVRQCCPEVAVILLTGHGSLDTAIEALRLGACDYLTKPLGDLGQLRESVAAALTRCAAARAADPAADAANHERSADLPALLLDQLPLGVILLDGGGRARGVNRRARAILAQRDGLTLGVDGRLYAARAAETAALRERCGVATPDSALSLSRPSCRPPYSVLVSSVAPAGARATTAVFVSDPEQRVGPPVEVLCQLHGLTPAEARVTAELLQGRSVEEAAGALSIARNTALTHLKRVFAKTNTSRQGDLISLLLSSPALLQRAPPEDEA